MDYLVSEGFPRAAEKFAKEANIQLPLEEESISSRVEIRQAIHAGDIDTAITKINDLNPQVCYTSRSPHCPFLAGLYPVSCTTHNFFDDNQTFSPQYDCKHLFFSILHRLLASLADMQTRSWTQTPLCTSHCFVCSSSSSFERVRLPHLPTSHRRSASHPRSSHLAQPRIQIFFGISSSQ